MFQCSQNWVFFSLLLSLDSDKTRFLGSGIGLRVLEDLAEFMKS